MDNEIVIALIGVGATLAGTILGWFLNSLSNQGKLNVFVVKWNDELMKNDAGEMNPALAKNEVEYYGYHCSLDIYNSSGSTKIMRNIHIVFSDGKTELKKSVPLDDATRLVTGQYTPIHYDEIGVINIPPKSVMTINFHNGIWDYDGQEGKLDFLWNTKSIKVQYNNEKNITKKIKVKDVNFLNSFKKQTQEEKDNG